LSQLLTFGNWLRQRRTELGITRDELSERVGFSLDLLRKLESGERRPSGQIAHLLADYLRIPADEREAFVIFARTGRVTLFASESTTSDAANGFRAPWRWAYKRQTNLPASLTPLIGREDEVNSLVHQIMHPKSRLVTLTGAPGVGKTRLALQVASDLVSQFENGVFLVELAPVADPDLVLQTIAHTLGLREAVDQLIAEVVLEYLRERRMLLVLDNFEQVLDAAPALVILLEASPWLKVLVTSREPLHTRGERRFPVPPLKLPESYQPASPHELLAYPSVELFVERSHMSRPDFALTEQNAGAVARICLALDGLPLAIELAAGHSGFLSPREIEARLGSRLQLLRTKGRDLSDRQRTLRGAIEWSYNLLSAREQAVFRRLGVFVGGYTIEAASAVVVMATSETAANGEPAMEAVETLEMLLDKSLITRGVSMGRGEAWGRTKAMGRLGMLETLKEYALEQLTARGEEEETRGMHARYYLAFVQEGGEHYAGLDTIPWVERVDADYSNLREALDWLLGGLERNGSVKRVRGGTASEAGREDSGEELERIALGAELCTALFAFWERQNYLSDARAWYTVAAEDIATLVGAASYKDQDMTAISRASELSPELPASWARMLTGAGAMAYYQGDFEEARNLNERGLAIRREIGDRYGIASCLNNLGCAATDQGDYAAARLYLSETLEIARELGISWKLCAALGNLAIIETKLGHFAEARVLLDESLGIARTAELVGGVADMLTNLGAVARLQEEYEEAQTFLDEALDKYGQLDHKAGVAQVLVQLGSVARDVGNYHEARSLYSEGLRIWAELGKKSLIADCLEGLASVSAKHGQPERAARLFGAAEHMRETTGVPLSPSERQDYDRYVAAAREGLDEARWTEAWADGRVMTADRAIAEALEQ
jgi:predicted ATPase/transcriptional regulator with XRE-family HTH domain